MKGPCPVQAESEGHCIGRTHPLDILALHTTSFLDMAHIGACGFTDWVSKCSESGAYHLPTALLPASLPENDGAVHLRRKEMIRWCRSQCIDCPSCRWISVSEENADCSLYRRCDTSALLTGNGHFVTLPVRSDKRTNGRSGQGSRDDNERPTATDERLLSTAAARLDRSSPSTPTRSEPFNGSTVAVVIVHATAESVDVVRGKWLPPTVPALFVGESDDVGRNLWYAASDRAAAVYVGIHIDMYYPNPTHTCVHG